MSDERIHIDGITVDYLDMTHQDLLDEIDEQGEGVTGWEIGFIQDYIERKRTTFTRRQSEILCKIYRERVLQERG